MQQKAPYALGIFVILIGIFLFLANYSPNKQGDSVVVDYKNIEYTIDNQRIRLVDGVSETFSTQDSALKIVTRYFGNEAYQDLNGDGREDVVFLLTQNQGGSGTFFYVVAALNTNNGYLGSQGFFLGDRIAPQTTHPSQNPNQNDVVVVNYADRASGEPFTTQPSIGKSVWLLFNPEDLRFEEVL